MNKILNKEKEIAKYNFKIIYQLIKLIDKFISIFLNVFMFIEYVILFILNRMHVECVDRYEKIQTLKLQNNQQELIWMEELYSDIEKEKRS